ncbi:TPA: hypothetical protein DEQ95_03305 [Candidatus Beckwithbacteria bacterium]|nr:MAG: hypothetical protein A2877_03415 [Candidatus Beckwithbacteria bacterium RIFCSPHIGHO2_01_FULL_49_39]OGD50199.1 MAG: hypothetical protein A3K56_00710 [Candidatus Beckwithbacteria bacterium RIFCSPHIGHO2_12_FULL_49_13]OGD51301.1 MAG: hypothetical protein A3D86_03575 [Candidatus Beckwithbacteria bacterium RIFCSPHIGHO2_02_FULL_49_13]OGD58815.1 MAG: hypothetical protein A3J22_00160 [Candidatus Beckwithbacteria bacterium RIFCSPLOWO2_02_FULL_49_12]OGD60481.1 MAG: hypothetical protein A3B59_01130
MRAGAASAYPSDLLLCSIYEQLRTIFKKVRSGAADAAPPKKSARNSAEGGKEKARKFLKNKT